MSEQETTSEEARAEAAQEVERPRTAEEIGLARFEAAKDWLHDRWEGAKSKLGRVFGFAKRLGISTLRKSAVLLAPESVYQAGKEKAAERYQHVSEQTKLAYQGAAERATNAYQKGIEVKDRIVTGTVEKINAGRERYRQARESIVNRIHDVQTQIEMRRYQAELSRETQSLTDLLANRDQLNTAIEAIGQRIEQIQSKLGGRVSA